MNNTLTNSDIAKNIIDAVGGAQNVKGATNCMTRLRLNIIDNNKVDLNALKHIPGVLGVNEADHLQVVLGPGKAKKVTDEVLNLFDIASDQTMISEEELVSQQDNSNKTNNWQDNKNQVKKSQKQSKLKQGLQLIANIFIPLIPAIIAAGLFQGFGSLIQQLLEQGTLNGDFWEVTRLIFSLIGTSFLGYFTIYTGINAAKQFGATEALGGMVGAMTIAAPIVDISMLLGLYDSAEPLNSVLTTGKGGIIGVIFGVYILSIIEKRVRKIVPDVLDLIVTAPISLLITAILLVLIVMPVTGVLSDWLVSFLNLFIGSDNWIINIISGYILSAAFLPMVLLGLHHGLIPIYAIQLETFGGVSLFPVLAMAGAGQVGAAIAIYITAKKTNNHRLRQVIAGALPAGFLGIGEPLIYGVTLPLGKPFLTAGLGAGFGGAYVMMTGVMSTAWGPSGLVAAPLMIPDKILHYLIGLVIAYIGGFIVTKIFIKADDLIEA